MPAVTHLRMQPGRSLDDRMAHIHTDRIAVATTRQSSSMHHRGARARVAAYLEHPHALSPFCRPRAHNLHSGVRSGSGGRISPLNQLLAANKGHQRPSEAIRGYQRPSEVIRRHQTPIRRHQTPSETIRGQSNAIRRHQTPSDAFRRQSVTIRRQQTSSPRALRRGSLPRHVWPQCAGASSAVARAPSPPGALAASSIGAATCRARRT